MIATYTAAGIRAAEEYWLARTAPGALMLRAARAVAATVLARLAAPIPGRRVALLVGVGNNGGDALHAGAWLRRRGVAVTAIVAQPGRAHEGGLAALRRAGGREISADDPAVAGILAAADAIVDGLVGLGAHPPLREPGAALVRLANASPALRVAVDLPSGISPVTGRAPGDAFAAHVTVTFGGAKTALLLAPSAGDVQVADIGMTPEHCDPPVLVDAHVLTDADAANLTPRPGPADNKFSLGVTGIVAGSARYPGAALLAVGGAVAARPGLVRYAGPQAPAVLGRWPEVVAVGDIAAAGRVQAWVVGPGIGTDAAAATFVRDVLAADVPVLVDADALTLLAADPALLVDRARRGAATLLTPHAGEFARLFPDLDPDGAAGRVDAVRAAAARCGATVLLKGHRTVIADPAGRTFINATASPYLATAGSGDVLAGLAGTLLAAGLETPLAAALAAMRHGRAGQRAEAAGRAGASALLGFFAG